MTKLCQFRSLVIVLNTQFLAPSIIAPGASFEINHHRSPNRNKATKTGEKVMDNASQGSCGMIPRRKLLSWRIMVRTGHLQYLFATVGSFSPIRVAVSDGLFFLHIKAQEAARPRCQTQLML